MRVIGIYNKIISTSIVLLLFSCGLEEIPEEIPITFEKTFGGVEGSMGRSVQQTQDGGYIITGSLGVGGETDVYLIKTDASGDTTFTKTFGGASSDYGNAVQQIKDGGYIITGYTESFGAGGSDVYLIKTDAFGDTTFTKTFGGASYDYGNAVQQTQDEGYIITGVFDPESLGVGGETDVYLIKTDASGNTTFTKTFGGAFYDYGRSVQQTQDGGYIITGSLGAGEGRSSVYLIKTNSFGDTTFTKTFGGHLDAYGNAVQQTLDGGYIITGGIEDLVGIKKKEVYLIKTDSFGESSRFFENSIGTTENDYGNAVQQTQDGGYIITGSTESLGAGGRDVYLIKTNSFGESSMDPKTFGGADNDEGSAVQQTQDGGYIITGSTNSFESVNFKVYLIKTDINGIVYNNGAN